MFSLVIDNGQIAQHGIHEELLEQPGIYQDFVVITLTLPLVCQPSCKHSVITHPVLKS